MLLRVCTVCVGVDVGVGVYMCWGGWLCLCARARACVCAYVWRLCGRVRAWLAHHANVRVRACVCVLARTNSSAHTHAQHTHTHEHTHTHPYLPRDPPSKSAPPHSLSSLLRSSCLLCSHDYSLKSHYYTVYILCG